MCFFLIAAVGAGVSAVFSLYQRVRHLWIRRGGGGVLLCGRAIISNKETN